jgi:hypothetical protein
MNTNLKSKFLKIAAPALLISAFALSGCATAPCTTVVHSTGDRTFNGNGTSDWAGSERMATTCRYTGDTKPANWNAPAHIEHMQEGENGKNTPN